MLSNYLKYSLSILFIVISLFSHVYAQGFQDSSLKDALGLSQGIDINKESEYNQLQWASNLDIDRNGRKETQSKDCPSQETMGSGRRAPSTESTTTPIVRSPIQMLNLDRDENNRDDTATKPNVKILDSRNRKNNLDSSPLIYRKDDLSDRIKLPTNNDVICLDKSKLNALSNDRFYSQGKDDLGFRRYSPDDINDLILSRSNYPDDKNRRADKNEYTNGEEEPSDSRSAYQNGNSLICYACSNVSNPYCDEPTKQTTVKYCSNFNSCIKKVVYADGVPVLVRDCGNTCEERYTGKDNQCSICYTELCNGAFSFNTSSKILTAICGIIIALSLKMF